MKHTLVEALYDWTEVLHRGSVQVDCMVIDFSNVSDVVPHEHLLAKLYIYVINGYTSNRNRSFFTNRSSKNVVKRNISSLLLLHLVFHKVQLSVHCYFFYILMI